jgi:hypothetical protein
VVTIILFPSHSFGGTAELFDRAARKNPNGALGRKHDEVLAGLDVQLFANGFGDDDLEFGRNADTGSLHGWEPPSAESIATSYDSIAIDGKSYPAYRH